MSVSDDEAKAAVLDEDTGEHLNDEEAEKQTERFGVGSAETIEAQLRMLEEAI